MGYTPGQQLGGRTVVLGGLTLGQVDAAGVAWTIGRDGLQGWDGTDVRTQATDRTADHGSWAGDTYLASRPITLAGTITAPDLATLDTAIEQLQSAVSLTDILLVVNETIPKQALVRQSGKPLVRLETDRIASYSVMLTAADPRRYSTVLQQQSAALPGTTGGLTLPLTPPITITASGAAGTFVLVNEGSIATRPVLTVAGPIPGFNVVTTRPDGTLAAQLSYSDTLNAGDVLVIDCDAHTVTLNGAVSRRRYLSGGWPEIPARSSLTVSWGSVGYDPSALLTGTCRSAWK
ncbi:phage tail domain-containing protein [Kitasatospora cineracea]|uniref:Tail protein n=1 Tax=Kitasatospora cineracea TaxID=88074 RepID=A0A3N4R3V9_9ACTN|nr:phage tail domain-containing protein [Kitasatospora cineracea]RPE27276.1 tail protein [Kitasatospora cineracea]